MSASVSSPPVGGSSALSTIRFRSPRSSKRLPAALRASSASMAPISSRPISRLVKGIGLTWASLVSSGSARHRLVPIHWGPEVRTSPSIVGVRAWMTKRHLVGCFRSSFNAWTKYAQWRWVWIPRQRTRWMSTWVNANCRRGHPPTRSRPGSIWRTLTGWIWTCGRWCKAGLNGRCPGKPSQKHTPWPSGGTRPPSLRE